MNRIFINSVIFTLVFLVSCTESANYEKPVDGLDAARKFITATLKGDKKTAKVYMLNDSVNNFILDKWKEKYDYFSEEEKLQYKKASIIVKKDSIINDSTEIIVYANSYKKKPFIMQVNKKNGTYVVDLKYTFYRDSMNFRSF